MRVLWLGILLAFTLPACDSAEKDEKNNSSNDPYYELRTRVDSNSIYCDGEACCWDDCQYNQTVCGQQKGTFAPVGSALDGFDFDSAPDWWTEERFYLVSDYELNVVSGRTGTFSPTLFYLAKYCSSSGFNTSYTILESFSSESAFLDYLEQGPPDYNCTTALNFCSGVCTPNCDGVECGSDGCGGSCGTCASGTSCSLSGQCDAGATGSNTCDTCISACSGLPGCCTGCGCICEDACGMCF